MDGGKDITPDQQAEYETELAKKARVGRSAALLICCVYALFGILPKSFLLTGLAALCLVLTFFGKPQAKWLAAGTGGFYAVLGSMTLADIPSLELTQSDIRFYETVGIIQLASGILSAVLFMKLPHIAAYFEYKRRDNR